MDLEYQAQWPETADWRRNALHELEGDWRLKAKFLALSYLRARALSPIHRATPGSSLHRYVEERPDTAGFIVWPYQCASWRPAERIRRVTQHFAILDEIGAPFPFSVRDKLLLWDLDAYSPGVRILLEQPKWLFREGLLTLSLFSGDHRAYSLAFSLFRDGDRVGIFIGGLQGRSTEGALQRYKDMTKSFHGLRPRDLLLDCLRMLAPALKAQRILAVSDDHRYTRHPYFGGRSRSDHADYDEAWTDRGGTRVDASHFELPMASTTRALEDVPSRKRALYRRRSEMLESLQKGRAVLSEAQVLRFEAT
ncbi:DUF535 family protein [Ramlibacter sp. PS3R-8]|uniref:VirK/YbjX family protein n=1 Tax=Ramlibacter sp. PS3R-8 TaxID=3133437 RepID=UPI0030973273